MGSFASKSKDPLETPPARPSALKRIEDPRSPTEEISRTPIEVTDRFSKDSGDMGFQHRTAALKEQNKYMVLDSSPRLRKEFFGSDFKKLRSTFASALESGGMENTTPKGQENGKENNVL